jgi:hypothetical protein
VKTAQVLRQHVSQRLRCPALRTKRNQHLVGAEASERLGGVACARTCACTAAAVVGVQTLKGTHNAKYSRLFVCLFSLSAKVESHITSCTGARDVVH